MADLTVKQLLTWLKLNDVLTFQIFSDDSGRLEIDGGFPSQWNTLEELEQLIKERENAELEEDDELY